MIVPPYPVGQSGITFDFTAEPPTIGINVSVGGSLSSGAITGISGVVVDFTQATPTIAPPIAPVGVSEMRLTLDSTNPVPTNDVVSLTSSSGRLTSGSTAIVLFSGLNSGLVPGMVVVSSGIPVGTFLTSTSGFNSVAISQAATLPTSGAAIQFIAGAIYSLPYVGNRVVVANSGGLNMRYLPWLSGEGTRCLLYDNRQQATVRSGDAAISGLTDTYQLARGMLAIMSGIIASGSTISSIESATSLTLSKVALSGVTTSGLIFATPNSGGVSSGMIWDQFVTVRSGVPWLRFGPQWTTTTSRLVDVAR